MKKFVALILALCMVLALAAVAGCGKTSDTSADTSSSGNASSSKIYIPVMAKGFQHQYWQAVKKGADDAAAKYNVEIYFDGPASETDIQEQVDMIKTEMAKNPQAMALAALDTDSVTEILEQCAEKKIPVIGFDSGVPNDTTGAVLATAATNNEAAAAIAADKFGEDEALVAKMKAATADKPVVIAVLSQDAVSASVTGRTTGFVNEMKKIASQYGTVSVEGHSKWASKVDGATIIIQVEISATTEAADVQSSANKLLSMNGISAVFCSNEGTVTGFLAATSDGEDLAKGGKYDGIVVAGFDAGSAQKNAVRKGWFLGSVTQDPYTIGYDAVEMCVKAINGEKVSDIDTGAKWYDSTNIDNADIALLVYD